jgi:hypothetical protein
MKKRLHFLSGMIMMLLWITNVFSRDNIECQPPVAGTASLSKSTACQDELFQLSYSVPFPNSVTVNSPSSIAGSYSMVPAAFGPTLVAPLTGSLVLADPSIACGPLSNAAEINGNIAVIDRGSCAFVVKVMEAQSAGAIAVIVVNNQPGYVNMGGVDPGITIPAVSVSQIDGELIKAALSQGTVNVTLNAITTQTWQIWDNLSSSWLNLGPAGPDVSVGAGNPGSTVNGQPGDRFRVKVSNTCGESYSNEVEIIYQIPGVASAPASVCEGSEYTISYSVPNLNADYTVTVSSPSSIAGSYPSTPALFGPILLAPLSGNLVLADPSLACDALLNASAINGNIAVVDRGACTFYTKVLNAQNVGAIAVIVVNNQPGLVNMSALNEEGIAIPVVMISQADGILIKEALNNGSVNMTVNPFTRQVWQKWDDLSSGWINFNGLADGDLTVTATNPLTTVNGLPGDRFRVKVINACGESYSNEIGISYTKEGPIAGLASSSVSSACEGEEFTLTYSEPDPNATQVWQVWDDASTSWIDFADAGVPQTAFATNPGTTINGQPGERLRVKVFNSCGESYSNEVEIIYLIAAKASITYAQSFNSPTSANVCEGSNFWLRYDALPIDPLNQGVTVNSPGSGFYTMIPASFGPRLTTSITGNLALANPTNACGPLTNAAEINGNIAVIDRGACTFIVKVIEAQNAGAIAVIVINNQPGNLLMGGVDPGITIPAVAISQEDGTLLKAAISQGPVNVTLNAIITQIWQAWNDATSSWVNIANAGGSLLQYAENPLTTVNGFPGDRYRVALTNSCGTSYSNELEIAYVPYPVATITAIPNSNEYTGGVPTNIYIGYGPQSVTLQPQTGGGNNFTYEWSGAEGLSCTDCETPVFSPTTPGTYTFTARITNDAGCSSTASISICVTDVRVEGSKGRKVWICFRTIANNFQGTPRASLVEKVYFRITPTSLYSLGRCEEPCSTEEGLITQNVEKKGAVDIEEPINPELKVRLWPNPASTEVMVALDEFEPNKKVDLVMMTIEGRAIKSQSVIPQTSGQQVRFDVGGLSAGLYLIKVQQGILIETKRVVIVR